MPIYEQVYRPWNGQLKERPMTWWVICKTGLGLLWSKGIMLLLFASFIPFIVRAVQIFLITRLADKPAIMQLAKSFQVNPGFFYNYLDGQFFFLMLMMVFAGGGLIANDKRLKALQVYFSKPVTSWDYLLGKWSILGSLGMLMGLVPSLLLFLMRIMLAQDMKFVNEYYWLIFPIIGYSLLSVGVLSLLILALSALSKNARSASIAFFAIVMFAELFRQILSRIDGISLISLQANIKQVGALFFSQPLPQEISVWLSGIVLAAVSGFCIWILIQKIKPTEVVS